MTYGIETDYRIVMQSLLQRGKRKEGRNGEYRSLPFESLTFDLSEGELPLITGRKMFIQGILGEYAAFIREPTCVDDFKAWGCNYWDLWADADGSLRIDYGNKWKLEEVVNKLRHNPSDRRILMNAWDDENLNNLSLPCCHYAYQFWTDGYTVDMLWIQRSADWCIGVPSDMILATVMLTSIAQQAGLKPGRVKMQFGDCHVYEDHVEQAKEYLSNDIEQLPTYTLRKAADIRSFIPDDLHVHNYIHKEPIKFKLLA